MFFKHVGQLSQFLLQNPKYGFVPYFEQVRPEYIKGLEDLNYMTYFLHDALDEWTKHDCIFKKKILLIRRDGKLYWRTSRKDYKDDQFFMTPDNIDSYKIWDIGFEQYLIAENTSNGVPNRYVIVDKDKRWRSQ